MKPDDIEAILRIFDFTLKIFPGVFAAGFAIFFSWRRLFHKIEITYSLSMSGFSVPRVNNIVLVNRKDRVEVVNGIEIVIDNKYKLKVLELKKPEILKPFEALAFETPEVTSFRIDDTEFDLSKALDSSKIVFRVVTPISLIVAKYLKAKKGTRRDRSGKILEIQRKTRTFNGIVINDGVLYGIIYKKNGLQKTGLVSASGFIEGEWDFSFNGVPPSALSSVESLKKVLVEAGFSDMVETFGIAKLKTM